MTKKRIVLPDGRYLIYYTFEDQGPAPADAKADAAKAKTGKPRAVLNFPKRRKTGR